MTNPTSAQILDCPMDPDENDAGARTVGEYLALLLKQVWHEEQGFSGKRPFGNSSWQWEIYVALGEAGLIEVTRNEWDEPDLADRDAIDALIEKAILDGFNPIRQRWMTGVSGS